MEGPERAALPKKDGEIDVRRRRSETVENTLDSRGGCDGISIYATGHVICVGLCVEKSLVGSQIPVNGL